MGMVGNKYLTFGLLWLLLLSGCEAGWDGGAGPDGTRAMASPGYLIYFGPAPCVKADHYVALVGFLPRVEAPAKVSPFPLFVPAVQYRMEVVAQNVIGFDQHRSRLFGLYNPFPPGTAVRGLIQKKDVVFIDLTRQAGRETDILRRKSMVMVLGNTLMQFPGVKMVVVSSEGFPLLGPKASFYSANALDVSAPGIPRLVAIEAKWDKVEPEDQTITLFFDRPIVPKQIRIADDDGRTIFGESHTGEFDMSIAMHPAAPHVLQEGKRVRVEWKVTDRLNGKGSGEQLFHLHQDPHH